MSQGACLVLSHVQVRCMSRRTPPRALSPSAPRGFSPGGYWLPAFVGHSLVTCCLFMRRCLSMRWFVPRCLRRYLTLKFHVQVVAISGHFFLPGATREGGAHLVDGGGYERTRMPLRDSITFLFGLEPLALVRISLSQKFPCYRLYTLCICLSCPQVPPIPSLFLGQQ